MSVIEKVENYRGYILTVEEAADLLTVSESSIYRDIYSAALNAIKIGEKRYIITKTDLLAFLKDVQTDKYYSENRDIAFCKDIFERVFGCKCYKGFWVNTNSVAKSLKVSETHLRNIVINQKITAEYIRANRRINMESLREYLDKNQTIKLLFEPDLAAEPKSPQTKYY